MSFPLGAKDYSKEWFSRILKDVRVFDFLVDKGTEEGDNYASQMNSVTIIDENLKELHLMIKHSLKFENESFNKASVNAEVNKRETLWYSEVVPCLNEFVLSHSGQKSMCINHPRIFLCDFDEVNNTSIIVMEHLKFREYEMVDKDFGLDYEHSKATLNEFAKLHGYSFAYHHSKENLVKKWPVYGVNSYVALGEETWTNFIGTAVKYLPNVLKAIPNYDQDLIQKFEVFCTTIMETWLNKCNQTREEEVPFCTLIHRDAWSNNILFDKNTLDTCIVDWQLMQFDSVANDICHLFQTSTEPDLRVKHLDEFLSYYYERFLEYSRACKVDPVPLGFTLDKLKRLYDLVLLQEVIFAIAVIPIQWGTTHIDFANLPPEEVDQIKKEQLINGGTPGMQRRLLGLVQELVNRNLL